MQTESYEGVQALRTHVKSVSSVFSLDKLAERTCAELEELYRHAQNVGTMRRVEGALRGRMLAVARIEKTPIARWVRTLAASKNFVWEGKTFSFRNELEGNGVNRIRVPGALGRQNVFPFKTRFGASAIDGSSTLIFDYDLAKNPLWIRKIHDEIREISPNVFLGPAMLKTKKGLVTVFWFALEKSAKHDE